MIYDASLDDLLQKVWEGKRIDPAEALRLYHLPLEELGALADRRRQLAKKDAYGGRGNDIVTYIVDRNVNYTNVCNVYCKFCAFYRTEKDDDAYVITREEMDKKIEETVALGGTQILMQGGHHPKLTKQWYLDLLHHIKSKFPQVNIHGFSPSEFVHFREVFNEPLEQIIAEFKAAGLGSIPGGGGEILVDRVRKKISPLKAMSDDWLGVMDVAHRLGLNSTATMMFGHVETVEDRIEHLERVRAQQDKSRAGVLAAPNHSTSAGETTGNAGGTAALPCGFTAFIATGFRQCVRNKYRGRRDARPTFPGFHGVHRLDVPGREHETEGADGWGARISPHAGAQPDLSREYREHPKFVGYAGAGHRPGRAQIRRERPGEHHD